ncbi:MAG: SDR family NAD(P)-dependent oxidoreductase [Inquilinaceae bacterium]
MSAAAFDFTDRVVLITGAAGNLGQAVAKAFGDAGASLVLVERKPPTDDAAGDRVMRVVADLTESDQTAQAAQAAVDRFGRIDVLCNMAGGFAMGAPVHAVEDKTWDLMMDLNARSIVHMARAVVPHMMARKSGRIVSVGATAALAGGAGMGAYSASKSAVLRLTEAMAAELGEHGIGVNCVLPSIIDTPQNRAALPKADPAGWVAPAALADIVLFLASDAARALHGVSLPVTGGVSK